MNGRNERADGRLNVLAFDPHHGQRLSLPAIEQLRLDAVAELAREDNRLSAKRIVVYASLFALCAAFWAGVIILAERVQP